MLFGNELLGLSTPATSPRSPALINLKNGCRSERKPKPRHDSHPPPLRPRAARFITFLVNGNALLLMSLYILYHYLHVSAITATATLPPLLKRTANTG